MVFVAVRTSADLSLTTPLDCCCNCGKRGPIELVRTPMRKTRYFFIFGTELTLNETFPYCRPCRRSARRVRFGLFSKMLATCLAVSVLFLVLVLVAPSLPDYVTENLFLSAVIGGSALSWAYFSSRGWGRKGSTYYQPVSLVSAESRGERLDRLRLRFYNKQYAKIFSNANAGLIARGILRVESTGE